MWVKSIRSLKRLTPRQLKDYYDRQLQEFFVKKYPWPKAKTFFQQRHVEQGSWWYGPKRVREQLTLLKQVRQMLRDGYERTVPKPKGAVGACAVDREEARPTRPKKADRKDNW